MNADTYSYNKVLRDPFSLARTSPYMDFQIILHISDHIARVPFPHSGVKFLLCTATSSSGEVPGWHHVPHQLQEGKESCAQNGFPGRPLVLQFLFKEREAFKSSTTIEEMITVQMKFFSPSCFHASHLDMQCL